MHITARPMTTSLALVAALMVSATATLASPGHPETPNVGQAGDISRIDRVIEVDLGEMYFEPKNFEVERGETVRFVLTNSGRAIHEFNLGTEDMQAAHLQEMTTMMREGYITQRELRHDRMLEAGMMHADPNSRLLAPGETAELIWTFSGEQDELIVACNVPGHRAAGMEGLVTIGDAPAT